MDCFKEAYQPPMVELIRISVVSVLQSLSVPSEEKVEVEGYELDENF